VYHLGHVCVPPVVRVPQVGNPWVKGSRISITVYLIFINLLNNISSYFGAKVFKLSDKHKLWNKHRMW
jgi:hypothetical protein